MASNDVLFVLFTICRAARKQREAQNWLNSCLQSVSPTGECSLLHNAFIQFWLPWFFVYMVQVRYIPRYRFPWHL